MELNRNTEKTELLNPVQRLVKEMLRKRGITMTDASIMLEKKKTYIQQFVWRGSPRILSSDTRQALAKILGVPPSALTDELTDQAANEILASPTRTIGEAPTSDDKANQVKIPAFVDTDIIDFSAASTLVTNPQQARPAMAIWLTAPTHPRVEAGDLIFLERNQPPRIGDLVAVLRDKSLAAVGKLVASTHASVQVDENLDAPTTISRDGAQVFKICVINCA